jgi:hypothetical protein
VVSLTLVVALLEAVGLPVLLTAQRWFPAAARPSLPWISDMIRGARWPLLGLLLLATTALVATVRAARAAHWIRLFSAVVVAIGAVLAAARVVIVPAIATRQTERVFMEQVRAAIGPTGTLSFYKTFDYGAVFYWHDHIPGYDGPLPTGRRRYLLTRMRYWNHMPAAVREQYELVVPADDVGHADADRLVLIGRVQAP